MYVCAYVGVCVCACWIYSLGSLSGFDSESLQWSLGCSVFGFTVVQVAE